MLIGAPFKIAAWTLARDGVAAVLMLEPSPPPTTTVIVLALVPSGITCPLPASAACVRNSAHIKTRILFTIVFSRCLIKRGFA